MPLDRRRREFLSDAALRGAFESSSDCIKVLDLAGNLLVMNAGGAAKMGLASPEALSGLTWLDFWTGEDRAAADAAVKRARAGGAGRAQGYLPAADGTPKWWDSSITPILGDDGAPESLLVISRDITDNHELARELKLASDRNDALVWATSEIVWTADATQQSGGGRGWTEFTGQDLESAAATGWLQSVHALDREQAAAVAAQGLASGTPYVNEYRLHHVSGVWRWVIDRAMPLRDQDGRVTEWVGIISDVHDRRVAEQALQESEERLRLAVEASGAGIWDVDMTTGHRIWSRELKRLYGLAPDAAVSEQVLIDLVHPDDRHLVAEANQSILVNGTCDGVTFRIIRVDDGETRWMLSRGEARRDANGRLRRVGTVQDITARKLAEEAAWTAANLDPLTGLCNRNFLSTKLEEAVVAAVGSGCDVGLLVIDIDHFKEINDTLGHDAGDTVLREVGARLAACVGKSAWVGRLGGDEFAVVLPEVRDRDTIAAAARDISASVLRPVPHGSTDVTCSVSVGFAIYPEDDLDASNLLKDADLALYAAKNAGRNLCVRFDPALKAAMEKRVAVLRHARESLALDTIVPFYQPKLCLSSGRIAGFEALLRLRGPGGLGTPATIAEAFDEPEIAVQIGQRMLDKVVGDMLAWRAAGVAFGSIALNVSAAELSHVDVAARTLTTLTACGLPLEALQIEVTESVFFGNETGRIGETLETLDGAGVDVSLDDFGTGFASLTHLRRFPIKWLKIDRSFINDIGHDPASTTIVKSVIGLSHGLGMRVVGEGVETPAQLEFLRREGCDLAQGYLISKPMSGTRVAHFLAGWRGSRDQEIARRRHAG